jgi:hypothetical protein
MRPALLLLLLAAGCSKKSADPKDCKPLTVSVDGAPLAGLQPTGLARLDKMKTDSSYEVEVFNHAKVTCEAWTNKKGRAVEPNEIGVRALAGGTGMMGKGVGIESHMQFGGDVSVVGAKPKAVGDKVTLCASEITFTPRIGAYKDKKVVISGLFEGSYCGEMEF